MTKKTYDVIIRVSSLGDRKEPMTIEDQRRRCAALVKAKGARLGEEHDATNVSGWISVASPQYRAAVDRIRSGASQGLVMGYFSRSARNSWALAGFFAELAELGADIWFADHPDVDYRSRDGMMLFGLMGVVNQDVFLDARDKGVAFAKVVILERGVANRSGYGYRRNAERRENELGPKIDPDRDARALVPDPETAPWVRLIFERRVAGWKWMEIRDELEARGAPPPTGKAGAWTRGTLMSIVSNELYLGHARYRRREGHRHGKRTDEFIRNESAHEPLVDYALWRRAQSTQSVQRTGAYAAGVAGGILVCGSCGGRMAVSGDGRGLTYSCRRQRSLRCDRRMHVMKRHADAYVTDMVENLLDASREAREAPDLDGLRARLAEAEAELEAFVRLSRAIDEADFKLGYQGRREARDAARELLGDVQSAHDDTAGLPTVEEFRAMGDDARRGVARLLIERVEVHPKEPGWDVQARFAMALTRRPPTCPCARAPGRGRSLSDRACEHSPHG